MKNKLPVLLSLALLATLIYRPSTAFAQGTAFTYQGRLTDSGSTASGSYDLQFTIYDSSGGVGVVAGPITNSSTAVSDGLFTVTLDFGSAVFDGDERWLEIGVATNGGGLFDVLTPRQIITSTPYAVRAGNFSGPVNTAQLTGTIAPANIAVGTITGEMLATGTVTSVQIAAGAVTGEKLASRSVNAGKLSTLFTAVLSQTLTNPAPATDEKFGYALASLGSDMIAIGAHQDGAIDSGSVYVFSLDGVLLTNIPNPSPDLDAWFGYSLAGLNDSQILVGARGADLGGATSAGGAFLLTSSAVLLTTFTNPTPAAAGFFGHAVAAVGHDKVLISAIGDGTGAANAGAAYLFSVNGALLTTYTNPTPESADFFGWSVAAVGEDKVLIGAYLDDTDAENAGAAYLFDLAGTLLTSFTNPFPASFDYFGASVAAVGPEKVLIGAYAADVAIPDAGAAYLFALDGTLLQTFTSPTPTANDNFGNWVAALDEDKVVIGDSGDNLAFTGGAAYVYALDGSLLLTLTNPSPAGLDGFGGAGVAAGRDGLLIGASLDNAGASDAGAAHLFSTDNYFLGLEAEGVLDGAIRTASLVDDSVTTEKLADGSVTSTDIADGEIGAADVNAGSFNTTFWRAAGNAGTTPGANFLGTTDNQPLELKVNNQRALRIESTTGAPNLIGGYNANSISSGTEGAIVAGGGGSGSANTIGNNADYSVIGGGFDNNIASNSWSATIAGGAYNDIVHSSSSAIGGGSANNIASNSWYATIAGGALNEIDVDTISSAIGGGWDNNIASNSWYATIAGGNTNEIGVNSGMSTIGGGFNNNIASNAISATIPGGHDNAVGAGAYYAFAAGRRAKANHTGTFVWADSQDADFASTATNQFLIRASGGVGIGTTAPDNTLHVHKGSAGTVSANANAPLVVENDSTCWISILSPSANERGVLFGDGVSGNAAGGIVYNAGATANGLQFRTGGNDTQMVIDNSGNVGVGTTTPVNALHVDGNLLVQGEVTPTSTTASNLINLTVGTEADGRFNGISFYESAGGPAMSLGYDGTVAGTANNALRIYDSVNDIARVTFELGGNLGLGVLNPTHPVQHSSGAHLTAAGVWTSVSDRNAKEDFATVDPAAILEKVVALPIAQWKYKVEAEGLKHLGPTAQDFKAAFGLGESDTTIGSVDADGVALAAIQGLNQKLERKETEITELKARLEKLEQLLNNKINGGVK